MANIKRWPDQPLEGDTTIETVYVAGTLGALFPGSDGGIWMYGRNTSGSPLAVGDVVKYETSVGNFQDTAAGDDGKGVQQVSAAQKAFTDNYYGWYPWIHPTISVSYTGVAIAIGLTWGLSGTGNRAKAVAAATAYPYGVNLVAVVTAGGAHASSLRC